jgi:hypothetical protein
VTRRAWLTTSAPRDTDGYCNARAATVGEQLEYGTEIGGRRLGTARQGNEFGFEPDLSHASRCACAYLCSPTRSGSIGGINYAAGHNIGVHTVTAGASFLCYDRQTTAVSWNTWAGSNEADECWCVINSVYDNGASEACLGNGAHASKVTSESIGGEWEGAWRDRVAGRVIVVQLRMDSQGRGMLTLISGPPSNPFVEPFRCLASRLRRWRCYVGRGRDERRIRSLRSRERARVSGPEGRYLGCFTSKAHAHRENDRNRGPAH